MKKYDNTVRVGLIRGRHEMPVDGYIFNESIDNVFDFAAMRKTIMDFLKSEVGIRVVVDAPIDSADYTDLPCFRGEKDLVVYVTGLTAVTAELISCCVRNGVKLTLMHYNSATGEYVPQRII